MQTVMGIALSVLFGVIPMAIYAAILPSSTATRRNRRLIGVFLWGLIVAAGAALVLNTAFEISLFLASGSEFDSILDGVIYGSLVGFGFAAAENVNYIFTGFITSGLAGLAFLVLMRAVVIAFLHATLTSFTGIGFAVARLNRGVLSFAGPLFGFAAAVGLHAFHNVLAAFGDPMLCLLGSVIDWTGFLCMFAFIINLVWRVGKIMRDHLHDEVRRGLITPSQYQAAASISGQLSARWASLTGGRRRDVARFYDLLGQLAFKKHQLARLGPERERNAQWSIESLRQQIAALRPAVGQGWVTRGRELHCGRLQRSSDQQRP